MSVSVIVAFVSYLISAGRDPAAWKNFRIALISTALTLAAFALWHLVRTPWLIHRHTISAPTRELKDHWGFGILGISVIAAMLALIYTYGRFALFPPLIVKIPAPPPPTTKIMRPHAETMQPHVIAYYRGGGQRVRGGRQWTVEVKRSEPHPQQLPYLIGPFVITNEGDTTTPKEPVASLDCSTPFQAYADPGLAPTDPRPVWSLNPAEAYPMLGPGHPAIYRYMKHLPPIGPGESAMLYAFWLNPSESEVRCKLIVTVGVKEPTTLDLIFKFKGYAR